MSDWFRGGLELLFGGQRTHSIALPASDQDGTPQTMKAVIDHMSHAVVNQKQKDLFTLEGSM